MSASKSLPNGCKEARRTIAERVAPQPADREIAQANAHLAECAECAQWAEMQQAFGSDLRRAWPNERLADSTRTAILQKIEAAQATRVAPNAAPSGDRSRLPLWMTLGTGVAAALVVVVALPILLLQENPTSAPEIAETDALAQADEREEANPLEHVTISLGQASSNDQAESVAGRSAPEASAPASSPPPKAKESRKSLTPPSAPVRERAPAGVDEEANREEPRKEESDRKKADRRRETRGQVVDAPLETASSEAQRFNDRGGESSNPYSGLDRDRSRQPRRPTYSQRRADAEKEKEPNLMDDLLAEPVVQEPILLIPGPQKAGSVDELLAGRGWRVEGAAQRLSLTPLGGLEVVPHESAPFIITYAVNIRTNAPSVFVEFDFDWDREPFKQMVIPLETQFHWMDPQHLETGPYLIDSSFYFDPNSHSRLVVKDSQFISTLLSINEGDRILGLRKIDWQKYYWRNYSNSQDPPMLQSIRLIFGPQSQVEPLIIRIHRLDVTW